jgi:hypothetical protein
MLPARRFNESVSRRGFTQKPREAAMGSGQKWILHFL